MSASFCSSLTDRATRRLADLLLNAGIFKGVLLVPVTPLNTEFSYYLKGG